MKIHVRDLDFSYGNADFTFRVDDLAVESGTTLAVIGASGSGKTTLLHLLAGIVVPGAGSIRLGDTEVTGLSDAKRRAFRIRNLGLVFQEFELLEYLNVLDNILLPYRINPALRLDRQVRQRACDLAHQVEIGDKLNRYVRRLSQGERQRVSVCRSLLTNPQLVLADEQTGNLDPANTRRVLDILFDYARDTGASLVVVTHDHELLDRFDRVVDTGNYQDASPAEKVVVAGGVKRS